MSYLGYKYSLEEDGNFACEIGSVFYNEILKSKSEHPFTQLHDSIMDVVPIIAKYNGKWGALSMYGETLIPFENDSISFLTATLFLVENAERLILKNYANQDVLNYKCDSIQSFYFSGLVEDGFATIDEAAIYQVGEKYGLYNLWNGRQLPPIYDEIESCFYHHDLGWQCLFFGAILSGEQTYNKELGHKSPNCIRFRIDGKYGLIEPQQLKQVTTELYDSIQFVRTQSATEFILKLNDRMTFLVDDFTKLHPTTYDSVRLLNQERFYNDNYFLYEGEYHQFKHYYAIQNKLKVGLLDMDGNEILPMEYENITNVLFDESTEHYQIVAKHNGKWGIINEFGEIIVPFKYKMITMKNGQWHSKIYCFENKGKIIEIPHDRLSRL
jgi:hypothetical protein